MGAGAPADEVNARDFTFADTSATLCAADAEERSLLTVKHRAGAPPRFSSSGRLHENRTGHHSVQ